MEPQRNLIKPCTIGDQVSEKLQMCFVLLDSKHIIYQVCLAFVKYHHALNMAA